MRRSGICDSTISFIFPAAFCLLLFSFSGRAQTPTPIAFGESLTSNLPTTASTTSFTTPYVEASDILFVRVTPSGIKLKFELFSPSGNLLKVFPGEFNTFVQAMYTIPENGEAGNYKILVSNTGIWTGDFCISLERMNQPPEAVFLGCNTSLSDTLECGSSIRSFRYLVRKNSRSRITVANMSGGAIAPEVWVCDSNGEVLRYGSSPFASSLTLDTIPAIEDGCYYVFVGDAKGFWHDDFNISHTIISGSCGGVTLESNPTTSRICQGSSITLSAYSPFPGAAYSWSGPNGFTSTQAEIIFNNATPALSGTYTVEASAPGVCLSTASKNITVHPLPTATASILPVDATICAGESFTLNVTSNAQSPKYVWSGPNGYTSTLRSPTIPTKDIDPTERRRYIVTVIDGNTGCSGTSDIDIQVNANPQVVITEPVNGAACEGTTLSLKVETNITDATFSWSGPAGFGSSLQNPAIPEVTFSNQGTYRVTVSNTSTGCLNQMSKSISIHATPTVDILLTPKQPLCNGTDFTLCATSSGSDPTYKWSGPGSLIGSSLCLSIEEAREAQSGTYAVTVTSSNGCSGVSNLNVEVGSELHCMATLNNEGSITTSATGGFPPYKYILLPNNTENDTGTFSDLVSGAYQIKVTDSNSCTCNTEEIVGVVDPVKEWGIRVTPNPGQGIFTIFVQASPISAFEFTLFDAAGHRLRGFILETPTNRLDLTNLSPGMYVLRVSDGRNIGALRLISTK